MKPQTIRILAVWLVCAAALSFTALPAAAEEEKRPSDWARQIQFPPLNPVKPPTVIKDSLPNGMTLLMVEDHELPLIGISASLRGGLLAEQPDRPGVVDLFNEAFRTGGTEKMSGDKIDEMLERIGAVVEGGAGEDGGSLYASMLKETVDQVLPVFADFLIRPSFSQDKVDLAKTHLRGGIARRNDEVNSMCQRELQKLLMGPKHPMARQIEYEDVDRLTREDLVAFHKATFRPDQTILAVWGDFQPATMKTKIAGLLGSWKAQGPAPKFPVPPYPSPAYSVNYIEKQDLEQTFLTMGLQGLRFDDPDYPAVTMMTEILGGGFSSRLFKKVRTEMGLAYSAGGVMVPAYDRPGFFYFFTSTKPSTTALALQAMLDEIKRIREEPVADDELTRAKEGYLNQFAFEYDSKREVISRLALYRFYGYPEDFNIRLRQAVEKVTKEDVLRVAQKHLRSDQLTILVAGRADQFDKPLTTFGEVRPIDISIPEPKIEQAPASPESLAKGRDLLVAASRVKGEAALKALKDLTYEGKVVYRAPTGEMELKVKYVVSLPDRFRMEITAPFGLIVQGSDGTVFWVQQGGQSVPLPDSAAKEGKLSQLSDSGCVLLLQEVLAGTLKAQSIGRVPFEGQEAELVVVTALDTPIQVFLDPASQEILGIERTSMSEQGPQDLTEVYKNYQEVSGLRLPKQVDQLFNGELRTQTLWDSIQANQGVDAAQFAKPAGP